MPRNKHSFFRYILYTLIPIGIIIIAYPHIMRQIYKYHTEELSSDFLLMSSEADTEDRENLRLRMQEYNLSLFDENQRELTSAEAYESSDFDMGAYSFEDGMAAFISIPAMDVELPVFLGASKENMDRGAVLLSQTSMPVGGINSNAVIAAHRGASTAAMFRDIEKLQTGDAIYLTNCIETLTYKVAETRIISPENVDAVKIQPGRDLITLVTCHPFPFNYQRYLVYAERA